MSSRSRFDHPAEHPAERRIMAMPKIIYGTAWSVDLCRLQKYHREALKMS